MDSYELTDSSAKPLPEWRTVFEQSANAADRGRFAIEPGAPDGDSGYGLPLSSGGGRSAGH